MLLKDKDFDKVYDMRYVGKNSYLFNWEILVIECYITKQFLKRHLNGF